MIKWLKILFSKLFKRDIETCSTIIDYKFLKSASKLAYKGRAFVYMGGVKALTDAWYDKNNIVYILVIKKENKNKAYNLRQWFKNF